MGALCDENDTAKIFAGLLSTTCHPYHNDAICSLGVYRLHTDKEADIGFYEFNFFIRRKFLPAKPEPGSPPIRSLSAFNEDKGGFSRFATRARAVLCISVETDLHKEILLSRLCGPGHVRTQVETAARRRRLLFKSVQLSLF